MKKKLLLIQFNEVNFEILKKYNLSKLKNFKTILNNLKTTSAEKQYKYLEPWIQWVSVYTGKSAEEHKIFRLGDIINNEIEQIFELVEKNGYSVGSILPMNCSNKLKKADYFIPDPWTQTECNNNFWIKMMTEVFSQVVNDNSKNKINYKNYLKLFMIFFKFSNKKKIFKYIKLLFKSKNNKYNKAIFFDLLIHDIHITLLEKYKTDFSSIFFNGCAHIQHHYFFNSPFVEKKNKNPQWYLKGNVDPLYEILLIYDEILGEYIRLNYDFILATGLSQIPSDNLIYYYRLKNHKSFLRNLKIDFKNLYPRMTRDFLIEFDNEEKKNDAKKILENLITEKNEKIFSEIDSRSKSLFVTLGYSKEIKKNDTIIYNKKKINFYENVSFVALKNGIHSENGYIYFSENIENNNFQNNLHVKNIYNSIKDYFHV